MKFLPKLEIFSTAPYYHLGGDEVENGEKCWKEAIVSGPTALAKMKKKITNFNKTLNDKNSAKRTPSRMKLELKNLSQTYELFERNLAQLSKISPYKIMRWEWPWMDDEARHSAFGKAVQYWMSSPEIAISSTKNLLVPDKKWFKTRRKLAIQRQQQKQQQILKINADIPSSSTPKTFWERLWSKKNDHRQGSPNGAPNAPNTREGTEDIIDRIVAPPFFASTGLYFDRENGGDTGYEVYKRTRESIVQSGATGVIGTTFELDKQSWHERNVWGKLVAIAMAVTQPTSPSNTKSQRVRPLRVMKLCFSKDI